MNLLKFLNVGASKKMPSSLDAELQGSKWVLRVTVLAFAGFFIWAYVFEIDQVSRAPGVVLPSSKVKIIQ